MVADAGMLSAASLDDLDEEGLGFIVGSRVTKAPVDLAVAFPLARRRVHRRAGHRHRHPEGREEQGQRPGPAGRPAWDREEHPKSWRAAWAFSARRFAHDNRTLTAQENRARDVISGAKSARAPRFVKNAGEHALDEAALARARKLAGLKGYVTNFPSPSCPRAR